MSPATDSAGQPWAGRHFDRNAFDADDGSAPEALMAALTRFRDGDAGESDVVDAFRGSRLLVPLVAELGEAGTGEHNLRIDKRAELSIVTVAGPDGRNVLPVFSSVQAMSRWNSAARPVPADGVRVALAAASEHTDLIVLDPTSSTEFVIRRPGLWAIAQSQSWVPSYLDGDVLAEFMATARPEPAVTRVELAPGDPEARLAGPELLVLLTLVAGLVPAELDAVVGRMRERWSSSELIAARVDSLAVRLVST